MRPINTPPSPTDTSVPSDERSSLAPGSPAVFATTLPGRRAGGPAPTFSAVREKYKNFDHVTIMTAS